MNNIDYIVVGAGSAGCVVAGRLSESEKVNICVLEAGPRDHNPFIHIPAGVVRTMFNPKLSWCYQTEPSEGTAFRKINQPRGKTLGGSGAINGHIYNRGSRQDYDDWAAQGNRGWSYDEVLPYFKRCERRVVDDGGTLDDQFRGEHGPFTITDLESEEPLCDAFIESAKSLSIRHNLDYNGADQSGIAYAQRSVYKGRRVSPARAFLAPAEKRGNTQVITDAHVVGIVFENKRATGVQYERGGKRETVYANKEVIICSGSIGSPQILQLSGIGDSALLKQLEIPLQHHLPAVGENLRDHYVSRIMARVDGDSINERVQGLRLIKELLRYGLTRRGALALTPTLLYAFLKSSSELERDDIQVTFTPASYPEGVQSVLDDFPGITIACWQQRPHSAGYVRARSRDPFDDPAIQPNYLSDPRDREVLLQALRWGRRIMNAPPFSKRVVEEMKPGVGVQSDEELIAYASQTGHSAYHPIGSCRMGPTEQASTVVSDQLKVHGIGNLRVADASIMPNMITANTNAASLMIGEKAAEMILADR